MNFDFKPIGLIHSCFKEKFGIPMQSRLIPEAEARLEILHPYNRAEAFRELTAYSHLWITFVFHASARAEWRPTVRPPRLGGNQRVGVFASRSPFRPNPIGLSVVNLLELDISGNDINLHLAGIDFLDGTPVLDIKPYLPYVDAVPGAESGYAPAPAVEEIELSFTPQAEAVLASLPDSYVARLRKLIWRVLQNDPRPAYLRGEPRSRFGMRLYDFNIRWEVKERSFRVTHLEPLSNHLLD
ncbi:MAG: tRNA (N6-threonylcarbamoyladenosine(37)-N6)-methyltransferase TrmO [Candidatus Thiodiazotropha sp. (ex Epidulcina cf. delphinae)]|nr:tRNA (N6-threonylcarbamoyladenosine(37)-N6)-methyltransferase TrmO [Candidatus Thiodiazotropha sp. (ex Epidulcina cf. delphinae)]